MEVDTQSSLPVDISHIAEQYQLGQPLALHPMRPQVLRTYRLLERFIFVTVIIMILFLICGILLFLYQYLTLLQVPRGPLYDEQALDLSSRWMLSLGGFAVAPPYIIGYTYIRKMILREVPSSVLVCTEGIAIIRPKGVEVTHWDEVQGILRGYKLDGKQHYWLSRTNRKRLKFGEALEDLEGLANLIRQQVQQREQK